MSGSSYVSCSQYEKLRHAGDSWQGNSRANLNFAVCDLPCSSEDAGRHLGRLDAAVQSQGLHGP